MKNTRNWLDTTRQLSSIYLTTDVRNWLHPLKIWKTSSTSRTKMSLISSTQPEILSSKTSDTFRHSIISLLLWNSTAKSVFPKLHPCWMFPRMNSCSFSNNTRKENIQNYSRHHLSRLSLEDSSFLHPSLSLIYKKTMLLSQKCNPSRITQNNIKNSTKKWLNSQLMFKIFSEQRPNITY